MAKKKGIIEEFWDETSPPPVMDEARKEFFDEFAKLIDPRSYGAEGILRSIVKLFIEFIK